MPASSLIFTARTALYVAVTFFSFLTWILAAALIGKTEHYFNGYYEASVELLVTGLLAFFLLPVLHFMFHLKETQSILGRFYVELAVIGVLFLLYLGGAAAMANQLPGLSYCDGFDLCSIASALEAFAWLSWISLLALLALTLTFGIIEMNHGRKNVWGEQFAVHGKGEAPAAAGVGMTQTHPGATV